MGLRKRCGGVSRRSARSQRLTQLPLPKRRYVPDLSRQSTREKVRSFLRDLTCTFPSNPRSSRQLRFRYGLDLFLQKFFWEAHEIWEPLWRSCPPESPREKFMRGLLLATAALLRWQASKSTAGCRLASRALAHLGHAKKHRCRIDGLSASQAERLLTHAFANAQLKGGRSRTPSEVVPPR